MGERRGTLRILVENPEGKDYTDGPGLDGRIIVRW
jgi:hypothetical protein